MYARSGQVLARAGVLAAGFQGTAHPNVDDIDGFIAEEQAEVDAAIAAAGYTTPATGDAAMALGRVVADGALLMAIAAKFPGGEQPNPAVARLVEVTLARYEAAWKAIRDGSHAALGALQTGSEQGSQPGVNDFWSREPDYGLLGSRVVNESLTASGYVAPYVSRGMKF